MRTPAQLSERHRCAVAWPDRGRSVIQEPSTFGATDTASDVPLGPVGIALMGKQGEALRQAAHIDDPA